MRQLFCAVGEACFADDVFCEYEEGEVDDAEAGDHDEYFDVFEEWYGDELAAGEDNDGCEEGDEGVEE